MAIYAILAILAAAVHVHIQSLPVVIFQPQQNAPSTTSGNLFRKATMCHGTFYHPWYLPPCTLW